MVPTLENLNEDTFRAIDKEYKASSKVILRYFLKKELEPTKVKERYQNALSQLRKYLDCNGLAMPKPQYYYDPEDKATWRFLTVNFSLRTDTVKSVINFAFKYNK